MLGLLHAGLGTAQSSLTTGATIPILWRAPSRQSLLLQRQLNFAGSVTADSSTETDGRSPAPVSILAGTVSLELLAKTLLAASAEGRYGGILLRRGANGQLLISTDASVPAGTILVDQGTQGTIALHARTKPSSEQLIQALTPLLR
ncbi:MAG: hypothetical protein VKO39_10980 [Cyanobacteriota bacterium]|nr:hypothetical protein [Cyanobacteriota bacterium]